jgi:hypothetical protein
VFVGRAGHAGHAAGASQHVWWAVVGRGGRRSIPRRHDSTSLADLAHREKRLPCPSTNGRALVERDGVVAEHWTGEARFALASSGLGWLAKATPILRSEGPCSDLAAKEG